MPLSCSCPRFVTVPTVRRARRGPKRHFYIRGSGSSTSLQRAISRWRMKTGLSGWSSTARSTTTPRCVLSSRLGATASEGRSDTEVLPHLYEEHGAGVFARLRGMFAVAILDRRQRPVLLARDRFGIKPLFYALVEDAVTFASEIRRGSDVCPRKRWRSTSGWSAPTTISPRSTRRVCATASRFAYRCWTRS